MNDEGRDAEQMSILTPQKYYSLVECLGRSVERGLAGPAFPPSFYYLSPCGKEGMPWDDQVKSKLSGEYVQRLSTAGGTGKDRQFSYGSTAPPNRTFSSDERVCSVSVVQCASHLLQSTGDTASVIKELNYIILINLNLSSQMWLKTQHRTAHVLGHWKSCPQQSPG